MALCDAQAFIKGESRPTGPHVLRPGMTGVAPVLPHGAILKFAHDAAASGQVPTERAPSQSMAFTPAAWPFLAMSSYRRISGATIGLPAG